jgi:tetraacyldisaccharide 4'-kinase
MYFLLYPFAVLYDVATSIRNALYDRGYKPSTAFDIPVISVGNLAVGGTGKTPMVEYLIRLLGPSFRIATLSRGYGRDTRGFRMAASNDTPATIGDEPFQLFSKFGEKITVAVGEERALAIANILQEREDTDVVILDDAFQHRKLRPSFQILLTDFERPFFGDFLLPAGRLRESRKGAARADVVIVSKCPRDLKEEAMMRIADKIRYYAPKPVFFTSVRYGNPIAFDQRHQPDIQNVVLVSGIARTTGLVRYVGKSYKIIRHFNYRDHHVYSAADVRKICETARHGNAMVITTEKDASKLNAPAFREIISDTPFFYLPIETEFVKNGKEFDEMILNVLKSPHGS